MQEMTIDELFDSCEKLGLTVAITVEACSQNGEYICVCNTAKKESDDPEYVGSCTLHKDRRQAVVDAISKELAR